MTEPLTYAVVGGPPDDWNGLLVFDLDSGEEVREVIEVDTSEGWLVRLKRDENGQFFIDPDAPDEAAKERLEGRFEIRRAA